MKSNRVQKKHLINCWSTPETVKRRRLRSVFKGFQIISGEKWFEPQSLKYRDLCHWMTSHCCPACAKRCSSVVQSVQRCATHKTYIWLTIVKPRISSLLSVCSCNASTLVVWLNPAALWEDTQLSVTLTQWKGGRRHNLSIPSSLLSSSASNLSGSKMAGTCSSSSWALVTGLFYLLVASLLAVTLARLTFIPRWDFAG